MRIVNVPKIAELSANALARDAATDPVLKKYLPDLIDSEGKVRHISRQFLFNVINTLKPEFFPANIQKILRDKKDRKAEKTKSYVDIRSELYQLIVNSELVSQSKDWYA